MPTDGRRYERGCSFGPRVNSEFIIPNSEFPHMSLPVSRTRVRA